MQQNTKAWLEWRGNALGSSDAPIIMGVSPYKTPYELWLEKTGRKEPESEKFAFAMGHRAEPIIRARAEERLDNQFEPACISCKAYPFMQASVDGRDLDMTEIMEIKVNPADVHRLLPSKPEAIPKYHWWQMQHQLIVTGARHCLYVSAPFRDDFETLTVDDLHIMPVTLGPAAAERLIESEGAFIECLATDTPPELEERDGVHMSSATWKRNAKEWLMYQSKIADLKRKQRRSADRLKTLSKDHETARGYGVCVKNTIQKGNVQYKKVPQLEGVDLDQYRGKSYMKSTISGED